MFKGEPYAPLETSDAPDAIEDALVELWTMQYGWSDSHRPEAKRWVQKAAIAATQIQDADPTQPPVPLIQDANDLVIQSARWRYEDQLHAKPLRWDDLPVDERTAWVQSECRYVLAVIARYLEDNAGPTRPEEESFPDAVITAGAKALVSTMFEDSTHYPDWGWHFMTDDEQERRRAQALAVLNAAAKYLS